VATERLRRPELALAEGARVRARRPHAAAEVRRRITRKGLLLPRRFAAAAVRRCPSRDGARGAGAGAAACSPHAPVLACLIHGGGGGGVHVIERAIDLSVAANLSTLDSRETYATDDSYWPS
jgi:hypothetical protein